MRRRVGSSSIEETSSRSPVWTEVPEYSFSNGYSMRGAKTVVQKWFRMIRSNKQSVWWARVGFCLAVERHAERHVKAAIHDRLWRTAAECDPAAAVGCCRTNWPRRARKDGDSTADRRDEMYGRSHRRSGTESAPRVSSAVGVQEVGGIVWAEGDQHGSVAGAGASMR